MKLNTPGPNNEKIALIDCGLMASINPSDREIMVSAIIHLANKDFPQLVNDFINLKILPDDCDRAKVRHSEEQSEEWSEALVLKFDSMQLVTTFRI